MIERVETTNTQAKKEGRGVREEKDDQGAGGSNQRIGRPKERQMKICGRERTEEANKQKTGCRGRRQAPVRRNGESEIGVGEEEEGSAAQEGSVGIQDDGFLALAWALDSGGHQRRLNRGDGSRRAREDPRDSGLAFHGKAHGRVSCCACACRGVVLGLLCSVPSLCTQYAVQGLIAKKALALGWEGCSGATAVVPSQGR